MRTVSLRDFCRQPTDYVKDTVALTQYGKTVGFYTPVAKSVVTSADTNEQSVDTSRQTLSTHAQEASTQSDESLVAPKGMRLSGKKNSCPICYESVPVELANQHYMKNHGDI